MTHNKHDDSPRPVTTDSSSCARAASPRSENLRQPAGTPDVLRGWIPSGTLSGLTTVILDHSGRATSWRRRPEAGKLSGGPSPGKAFAGAC
jgi:hypothetical protein